MTTHLLADDAGSTDWVARWIAILGFLVNLVALIVTVRTGRRVRATTTVRDDDGVARVFVEIAATGNQPGNVVAWGLGLRTTRFSLPRRAGSTRPRGLLPSTTGPIGSTLPALLPAGDRMQLSTTFALLQKTHGEVAGKYVYGWAELATKRWLVRTKPVKYDAIVRAFP
ncbi:MAG TPA: hypothetical protein VH333_04550 [Pseudonocardiaceae bacterium]|jgi:hypothetical protein|nr:hypothetical protein [Pseudonocardiaceae bacterium]